MKNKPHASFDHKLSNHSSFFPLTTYQSALPADKSLRTRRLVRIFVFAVDLSRASSFIKRLFSFFYHRLQETFHESFIIYLPHKSKVLFSMGIHIHRLFSNSVWKHLAEALPVDCLANSYRALPFLSGALHPFSSIRANRAGKEWMPRSRRAGLVKGAITGNAHLASHSPTRSHVRPNTHTFKLSSISYIYISLSGLSTRFEAL